MPGSTKWRHPPPPSLALGLHLGAQLDAQIRQWRSTATMGKVAEMGRSPPPASPMSARCAWVGALKHTEEEPTLPELPDEQQWWREPEPAGGFPIPLNNLMPDWKRLKDGAAPFSHRGTHSIAEDVASTGGSISALLSGLASGAALGGALALLLASICIATRGPRCSGSSVGSPCLSRSTAR